MRIEKISYKNTHLFSKLLLDYMYEPEKIDSLYSYKSSIDQISAAIDGKSFTEAQRNLLVNTLLQQDASISINTRNQIELLNDSKTFTICTAHQPLLMGGPVYFIHKIASCIQLSRIAKKQYPDYNFVPIYWIGSEDHDIEEVNHLHLFNKKIEWQSPKGGPVGKKILDQQISALKSVVNEYLGQSQHALELNTIIEKAYQEGTDLTNATRKLVYALFEKEGIVVLDQNDRAFKHQMIDVFQKEIEENASSKQIASTLTFLENNYAIQASPREINLFYLTDTLRERIIESEGNYKINNTDLVFSKEELLKMIEVTPEKFSPNVILRPLYQETILPNLAFVGGAGEIAYWLQLKNIFTANHIAFPMLVMRDMALYIDEKTWNRFIQKGFSAEDIFKPIHELEKIFISKNHATEHIFQHQKDKIIEEYDSIAEKMNELDKTLLATVQAEKQKILNSISMLEAKTYKAFKKKSDEDIAQIHKAKGKLYPNDILQERYDNFMMYYLQFGKEYIPMLIEEMNAWEMELKLVVY
ncbi:MAG: bacillithiol biosynthesis cysteine-adding enzyme BshC [Bacteroidota bacterium]